jgi:hypothetical protein
MGLPGKPDGMSGAKVEEVLLGRTDSRDCRVLRVGRDLHVPGMAAV